MKWYDGGDESQMGTPYKRASFKPVKEHALHGWQRKAMENRKERPRCWRRMVPKEDSIGPLCPETGRASVFRVFARV
ncbi:hypothetical protein R1flu_009140 [Riccia fluitans]|uniref:Uncharacterized protein n=1 Tax=Riccia fluitans TaxID=41844 RepID=A0ABD1Z224_9MARC